MKIIYLLLILFHYVFSYFIILDTDLNETIGSYPDRVAEFGIPFYDLEQGFVFESKPLLACGDSISPPLFNNTRKRLVALIKRGNCSFFQKVAVAEASGFTGVIIYNNVDESIFKMDSDAWATLYYNSTKFQNKYGHDVSIPARMVSLRNGLNLLHHYTFTASRQNYVLIFRDNPNFNPQLYIIAFLGFVSLGFFIIGIGFGIRFCRDVIKRRANRLRKCHLKIIPLKKFVKGQDPYETCAVCLEDFKDGDKLRILPCNHAYHAFCIDPWLLKQKRNCPICKSRIKIPGRDDDSDSVDDVPPPNNQALVNEHTPLINASNSTSSPRYLINNETDVNFIPNLNPVNIRCYENLTFGINESEPGTSANVKSSAQPNTDHSHDTTNNDVNQSDLTKII